jgi:hypothetical protein
MRKQYTDLKGQQRTQNSRAEVKPKTFVQSGHGMPPMSTAQASSATAHPSSSVHTGMLRYSSTMSRVLYLRANRQSIMTNSSPSGRDGFFVYESWRGGSSLVDSGCGSPGASGVTVWYNQCYCQSEGHLLWYAVTGLTTPDLYEKFKQPNWQSFSMVLPPSSSKTVRRW